MLSALQIWRNCPSHRICGKQQTGVTQRATSATSLQLLRPLHSRQPCMGSQEVPSREQTSRSDPLQRDEPGSHPPSPGTCGTALVSGCAVPMLVCGVGAGSETRVSSLARPPQAMSHRSPIATLIPVGHMEPSFSRSGPHLGLEN